MYRRHLLIIGAFGSMLAACELPFGPTNKTHVAGSVFDTLARRVPGAVVLILDGPQAGASTSTDESGGFEFVSTASGAVRLRASRDGFEPATIATEWQPGTSLPQRGGIRFNLFLRTLEPELPITPGSYTLTVTSDLSTATGSQRASCTGFPADLLSRTFEASISIWSPPPTHDFLVELASPTLTNSPGATCRGPATSIVRGCFALRVAGQFVGFGLENGWGRDWIEELPGFRYLTIEGGAPTSEPATSTETSITIPFWGTFEYCELKSGLGGNSYCYQVPAEQVVEYRSCSSRHNTMVFTKR